MALAEPGIWARMLASVFASNPDFSLLATTESPTLVGLALVTSFDAKDEDKKAVVGSIR